MQKCNYRKKYKQHYGIEFGKEYVVHHIDGDRSNNEIENLVLLPAKLHARYHFQKAIVESQKIETRITGHIFHSQRYYLQALDEFLNTLSECNDWYDYKMYLDGLIPNISGIKL